MFVSEHFAMVCIGGYMLVRPLLQQFVEGMLLKVAGGDQLCLFRAYDAGRVVAANGSTTDDCCSMHFAVS